MKTHFLAYLQEAEQHLEDKNYYQALKSCSQALEAAPGNPLALATKGKAFLGIKKYSEALENAALAKEENPQLKDAYLVEAEALYFMGIVEDALRVLDQGIEACNHFQLHKYKGFIASQQSIFSLLPTDHPERFKFAEFFEWLQENGCAFDPVEFRYYSEDFRGVHASKPICRVDTAFSIPKSLLVTVEMTKRSQIGEYLSKAELLSPKHSHLAAFLLEEKHKRDSFWKSYISVLPEWYEEFPVYYTEQEKALLKGSPFLKVISSKLQEIQNDYESICKVYSDFSKYSLKEFSDMRLAVSSRVIGVLIEGVESDAMVPLADMLNHSSTNTCTWSYENPEFVVEALCNIQRGSETTISYGNKCNSVFLLNYGFLEKDNLFNEFPVTAELSPSDAFFSAKKEALGGKTSLTFRLSKTKENSFFDFLAFLRFLEIDTESNLVVPNCTKVSPFNYFNEQKALQRAYSIIVQLIEEYPTTLTEDKVILAEELTQNEYNCLLLRIGEKEVLHFYKELLESTISYLDTREINLDRFESLYTFKDYLKYLSSDLMHPGNPLNP